MLSRVFSWPPFLEPPTAIAQPILFLSLKPCLRRGMVRSKIARPQLCLLPLALPSGPCAYHLYWDRVCLCCSLRSRCKNQNSALSRAAFPSESHIQQLPPVPRLARTRCCRPSWDCLRCLLFSLFLSQFSRLQETNICFCGSTCRWQS